ANISLRRTRRRRSLVDSLLSEASNAFPEIRFELDAESRTANAQAISRGDIPVVRIYGGFAFNCLVGQDALVFSLLHETGHLLARGHRHALDPRLACEC